LNSVCRNAVERALLVLFAGGTRLKSRWHMWRLVLVFYID
jgi:hypothetical protein